MTAALRSPAAGTGTGTAPEPAAGGRSRAALTLVIVLVLLATVVMTALRGGYRDGPLEPDAPTPQGSRAVVRVLEGLGTTVTTVRHTADAAEDLRGGATVLVTDPMTLGTEQLDLLREALRAPGAGRLVLVAPDGATLGALTEDITPAGRVGTAQEVPAGDCGDLAHGARAIALADEDDAVAGPARSYRTSGSARGCFTAGGGSVLAEDGNLLVLGSADVLTNRGVGEADGPALALNLLGGTDLSWYVPSPTDPLGAVAPSLLAHLPDWAGPVALWLLLVVAVGLLAAGRRLGAVVVEPLHVTARGQEIGVGRGRLLERATARTAAADSLRAATAGRLASRLGLRRQAAPDALAALVAALAPHTDRTPAQLHALLGPHPVDGDQELLRLAHDLDALEKEIDR